LRVKVESRSYENKLMLEWEGGRQEGRREGGRGTHKCNHRINSQDFLHLQTLHEAPDDKILWELLVV
jgi:hypothetical protein